LLARLVGYGERSLDSGYEQVISLRAGCLPLKTNTYVHVNETYSVNLLSLYFELLPITLSL